MDEDELVDTQWTPEAKQAYEKRAEELIEAIRAHVAANITRSGRQKELGPYFESSQTLLTVARAFEEAEFNWCGSVPLGLGVADDEEEGGGDDRVDGEVPQGGMLSIFRRWDLRILDEAAVIAAGRAAYLQAWPDDTEEDASIRVEDAEVAASELIHADGLEALATPRDCNQSAERRPSFSTTVRTTRPLTPTRGRSSTTDDAPASGVTSPLCRARSAT